MEAYAQLIRRKQLQERRDNRLKNREHTQREKDQGADMERSANNIQMQRNTARSTPGQVIPRLSGNPKDESLIGIPRGKHILLPLSSS